MLWRVHQERENPHRPIPGGQLHGRPVTAHPIAEQQVELPVGHQGKVGEIIGVKISDSDFTWSIADLKLASEEDGRSV